MDSSDSFERIFNPRTVAIVGASEDPTKMGGWCMSSFIHGRYPGKVFPINPKSREIRGIKTYASLNEVPEQIDLAVVVVPSSAVASVLVQCAERGAKGAVIISAGFREMDDPSGQLLQKEIAIRFGRMGECVPKTPVSGFFLFFLGWICKTFRFSGVSFSWNQ